MLAKALCCIVCHRTVLGSGASHYTRTEDLDNAVQVARPFSAWEKAFNTETCRRYSYESNHEQASGIWDLVWLRDTYHLPSRFIDFPPHTCRPYDKPPEIPKLSTRIDDRSITSFTYPCCISRLTSPCLAS